MTRQIHITAFLGGWIILTSWIVLDTMFADPIHRFLPIEQFAYAITMVSTIMCRMRFRTDGLIDRSDPGRFPNTFYALITQDYSHIGKIYSQTDQSVIDGATAMKAVFPRNTSNTILSIGMAIWIVGVFLMIYGWAHFGLGSRELGMILPTTLTLVMVGFCASFAEVMGRRC